jgi:hypothetical protein
MHMKLRGDIFISHAQIQTPPLIVLVPWSLPRVLCTAVSVYRPYSAYDVATSIGIATISDVHRRLSALNFGSCLSTSYGVSVGFSGFGPPTLAMRWGILGKGPTLRVGCGTVVEAGVEFTPSVGFFVDIAAWEVGFADVFGGMAG